MNYYKLNTRNFIKNVVDQEVDENNIINALDSCYQNAAFSTFPYIMHGMNSEQAINTFNSGNCVALSMYVKKYLWNTYRITSYLIPATIPNKYKVASYLDICHVALAIPKNKDEIYLADPAFYFLNPIKISTNSSKPSIIFSKNIYKEETYLNLRDYVSIEKIESKKIINKQKIEFNKYQQIPKNTTICQCNDKADISDTWCYFLREVINPDRAISTFFINSRKLPFICSTKIDDNGVCINDAYLKIINSKQFKLSFESKQATTYTIELLSNDSIHKIENKMKRHLNGNLKKYLLEKNLKGREYIIHD